MTAASHDEHARLLRLDGVRGIAILLVFTTHAAGFWKAESGLPLTIPFLDVDAVDLFQYGYLGISLFFLLSGYLLTWTERARAERGEYSISSYARRRALRLVPAFWVSIAVVVLVWPTSPTVFDVLAQALFLTGVNPHSLIKEPVGYTSLDHVTWTLTAEVLFYAAVPFIVLRLRTLRQQAALFGSLLLLSLGVRILIAANIDELLRGAGRGYSLYAYLYFLPVVHLYLFGAGVLLRGLVERFGDRPGWARGRLPALLVASSALFLVLFPYAVMTQAEARRGPWAILPDLAMLAFFAAALLAGPTLGRCLSWRPLVFLGMVSYSLFLLHKTILLMAYRHVFDGLGEWLADRSSAVVWGSFAVCTLAVFATAVTAAYLSFRLVERPFLRLKPR